MKKLASIKDNPEKWTIKATCDGNGWNQEGRTPCGSLFELDSTDIQKRTYTDYGGGTDTYYGFTCPDCGCFSEIPSNKIPSHIRSNARKYEKPSLEKPSSNEILNWAE